MSDPLHFGPQARYGAALVGTLFAGYLCIVTSFDAFIEANDYAGAIGTDVPLVDVFEFILILGILVVSFSIMPVSGARRLTAVTLACVVLLLWATVGIERGVGNISEPVALWTFLVNQGMITLIVSLGGWLIVRGRPPLAYLVLLLVLVPPLVTRAMVNASVTSGAYTLVTIAMVVIFGVGGAWLAALIDRLLERRRAGGVSAATADPDEATRPPAGSPSPPR
jgi:hypothetical protein